MDAIRERLDALLADFDPVATRSRDPVGFVHRYVRQQDQEVVGLVAATLAFGNVVAARRSIELVLERLGPEPAAFVAEAGEQALQRRLDGFVHRIYRGQHIASMLCGAGTLLRDYGSLGEAFASFHRKERDFRESLACFADVIRGDAGDRSARHLVSNPRAGSACKRLVLYARWMVRPADGVDLGLWTMSPSELVIPVDTHIHRISRNLGLTSRRTASWVTAQEITNRLRELDPEDPVKYDFALCHFGVSRQCPSRPVHDKCARCVLQEVCGVWAVHGLAASAQEAG
ncbi:MAG: TIGR02757 family protein [Polyangiales bacterium]